MYPVEISNYVNVNLKGLRLSKNRKSGYSMEYTSFLQFCDGYGTSIEKIFPQEISFTEIVYCIENNTGVAKCSCGNILLESYKGRKWCSWKCRSNDKSYCKSISKTKTSLYNDPEWKDKTEVKKVATCLKNNGVNYPMQNIDIFKKQQAACFEKDVNGLHGYEPHVYPFLEQLYPSIILGIDYMISNNIEIKWKGADNKFHHSYPDFFVADINSFIEIKSDYTRTLHTEKLMKCRDELYNMKYGYIICVVEPRKAFNFETYNHNYIIEE